MCKKSVEEKFVFSGIRRMEGNHGRVEDLIHHSKEELLTDGTGDGYRDKGYEVIMK